MVIVPGLRTADSRKPEAIEYLSEHWKKEPCEIRKRHVFSICSGYHGRVGTHSLDRRRANIELEPEFCSIPDCRDESCKYCHNETEFHYHRDKICTGICPSDWAYNLAKSFGITLNECFYKKNCSHLHCKEEYVLDISPNKVFHHLWLIRGLIDNVLDIYQEKKIYKIGRSDLFKLMKDKYKYIHQGIKDKIKDIEDEFVPDDDITNNILQTKNIIIDYCLNYDVDEVIINEIQMVFEFVKRLYS